jgi:hypothetical protein
MRCQIPAPQDMQLSRVAMACAAARQLAWRECMLRSTEVNDASRATPTAFHRRRVLRDGRRRHPHRGRPRRADRGGDRADGIPEVWIVDLEGALVEVYREPSGHQYTVQEKVGPNAVLRPVLVPGVAVPVENILA